MSSNNHTVDQTRQAAQAEELGALVFESALLQYLAEVESAEAEKFEQFVFEHSAEENFLEDLFVAYPAFREILQAEMLAVRDEVSEIVK